MENFFSFKCPCCNYSFNGRHLYEREIVKHFFDKETTDLSFLTCPKTNRSIAKFEDDAWLLENENKLNDFIVKKVTFTKKIILYLNFPYCSSMFYILDEQKSLWENILKDKHTSVVFPAYLETLTNECEGNKFKIDDKYYKTYFGKIYTSLFVERMILANNNNLKVVSTYPCFSEKIEFLDKNINFEDIKQLVKVGYQP